jgi:hypothetical protein
MGVGELASSKRPSIKRRWRYPPLMSATEGLKYLLRRADSLGILAPPCCVFYHHRFMTDPLRGSG